MDLTRAQAHSYAAPKPKSYVGVGLVVALHLAGIYALSAGLIKPPPRERPVTDVKALPPDAPKPPDPVERVKADKPVVSPIHVPEIPVLPWTEQPQQPKVTTSTATDDTSYVPAGPGTLGAKTSPAMPTTVVEPAIRTPGAICSTMPQPVLPAVNWSGEAVLQVLATVRGGRVVGSEFRVTQGVLDGKTRRSLQRSVESALAGYQCQGDATFQQDFAFRLD